MLKIIAGKYKGRIIPTSKNSDYRPSTGKFREAVFSILTSGEFVDNPVLDQAEVLDLFAGTGSLAFEALSRGAAKATLIDIVEEHLKSAKIFASQIGELDNISFLRMDATIMSKAVSTYDLVFMDPPYHQNLAEKTLNSLIKGKWLKPGAIIVIEVAKTEKFTLPERFELIKQRNYGYNKLYIVKNLP
jgi:16S rRNA (guanine966-N2)-methyltransferase